jgi:thiol-disulfide isomerase/thioredoxin
MREIVMIFLLATCLVACKEYKFKLSGTYQGENGMVKLYSGLGEEKTVIDSFALVHGRFKYKKEDLKIGSYFLEFPDGKQVYVLLENGELTVDCALSEQYPDWLVAKVKGSINNDLDKQYRDLSNVVAKNHPTYTMVMDSISNGGDRYKLSHDYADEIDAYQKEKTQVCVDFLKEHADKYFVVTALMGLQMNMSYEQCKELYTVLSDELKKHANVVKMKTEMDLLEKRQPGKQAPDFTLNQPDGTPLSLSDLRGKYVMLDFWASWCKPCRMSFPHLKELYAKYHKKGFEVLAITNDSNEKAWKKAIKADATPWKHVIDEFPKDGKGGARVIGEYAFNVLPSTLLIDPEGKVIGSFHGEELDQKLAEIFGE